MKRITGIIAAAVAVTLPSAAQAQSGDGLRTMFECSLRNGKTVRVTSQGGNLFYRYGTQRRDELSLRGSPRSGNVFIRRERYASMHTQLRFVRGTYSYIVHSMGGNAQTGSNNVSGLVVMRGTRRISSHSCRQHAEFRAGFDLLDRLPEDSETYSAM